MIVVDMLDEGHRKQLQCGEPEKVEEEEACGVAQHHGHEPAHLHLVHCAPHHAHVRSKILNQTTGRYCWEQQLWHVIVTQAGQMHCHQQQSRCQTARFSAAVVSSSCGLCERAVQPRWRQQKKRMSQWSNVLTREHQHGVVIWEHPSARHDSWPEPNYRWVLMMPVEQVELWEQQH